MNKVAILPVPDASGEMTYHALSGEKQSHGRTAGKALDRLTAQLREDDAGTMVVIQHQRADAFFNEVQQRRLGELMARWRAARDSGADLSAEEQAELDSLVEEEVRAKADRTAALLDEIAR